MTATDLWGDLALQRATTASVPGILKEQAKLLGQKTNNDVCAEVWSSGLDGSHLIQYSFQLWSPKIPNYTYTLFRVRLDPVDSSIWVEAETDRWTVVADFESWLASVLTSETTREKVRLLSQSATEMASTAVEDRTLPIQQALAALRETRSRQAPFGAGRLSRFSSKPLPKPE